MSSRSEQDQEGLLQDSGNIISTSKASLAVPAAQTEDGQKTPPMTHNSSDSRAPPPTGEATTSRALDSASGALESSEDAEEWRPPLPPRPSHSQVAERPKAPLPTSRRPALQSNPTTAISSVDIQTLAFPDGSRGTFATSSAHSVSESTLSGRKRTPNRKFSREGSEIDDTSSLISYAATNRAGDLTSLLDGGRVEHSPAWTLLNRQTADSTETGEVFGKWDMSLNGFEQEFDEVGEVDSKGGNEEELLFLWKSKLKHYLILSSAGKPIYSRHGDQNLINGYIGIILTIISFFQTAENPLTGFTAGATRFVVHIAGPLYFVAISKLGESDVQIRAQLEALYMQILSTLTLPTLTHLFTNRPNTDLRRPLEGTETLLSSLADSFTKGSASALLSSLECLRLRKSERQVIHNTLLKMRTPKLLYGLIVAGGRLVSVIRPKRHSLHPSDLQLIFNMLFEAGSVRAGEGENFIPICLPGFNSKGYLYLYVSFASAVNDKDSVRTGSLLGSDSGGKDKEVAILLISAEKESFFDLKKMRDDVVKELERSGSIKLIKSAIRKGRPSTTEIVPGTQLLHFLYKSRANVQFFMPTFSPHFNWPLARRRLMDIYHNLHASTHAKHSHLKVIHRATRDHTSLAWSSPVFEFYCVAGPHVSRAALTDGANQVVRWVKREEERVFIIGGAVF